jgi:hypothetical protein
MVESTILCIMARSPNPNAIGELRLDRVQAMDLLKEIASKIPDLGPQAMSIVESEPNNPQQTGCTIHFKGLSTDCIEQIKTIVKNHSLAISDNGIDLAIYTPTQGE